MRKSTVLGLLALSLCACAPVKKDPFAGFDVTKVDPGLKSMKAAMVISENTKNAIAYMNGVNPQSMLNSGARFDSERYFEKLATLLRNRFRDVVKVGSPQDATSVGADIVVILDVYVTLGGVSGMKNEFQNKMIFLSPDGSQIDVAEGVGVSHVPFPAFTNRTDVAATASIEKLDAAVDASDKVKEFARTHASPAAGALAAATTAPAAPAVKILMPRFNSPERPDDLAVIIGIESYSEISSKAPYAERDADAFRAHVRALGVPERNIVLLTGSKAGYSAMVKNVEVWLPRLVKPTSRVYFYFSGHGAPDVKTGQAYLVPWDGDPNFLEATAYPVSQLYRKLGALPAKEILVAMDSCFSGAGGRSVLATGARPLVSKIETGAVPSNVVVLSASASNEISGSLEMRGYGAFTYFLLEGLNAGKNTPRALLEYVVPRVQDESRRLNRDQTPQLQGDGSWSLR